MQFIPYSYVTFVIKNILRNINEEEQHVL